MLIGIEEFAQNLSTSELPDDIQDIAAICGKRSAVMLAFRCSGIPLDIPKKSLRDIRKAYIKRHFNGKNAMSIAVKMGIDASSVTRMVNDMGNEDIPDSIKMPNVYMKIIEDKCGYDFAVSLLLNFAGMRLYIRKSCTYQLKKEYIRRFFDGTNSAVLASHLDVTERFVRETISEQYQDKSQQIDLFTACNS